MHGELEAIEKLRLDQRYDEAMPLIEAYVGNHPDDPDGHGVYGILLREQDQVKASIKELDQAAAAAPSQWRTNYAMSLLHAERWAPGWGVYESRFSKTIPRTRHTNVPFWDGADPKGRRLMVFQEQGKGDGIQFARYLKVLSARGARITFW